MMRGRKPKPTALKILHGNPGKRPLSANEPKPRRVLPRCPDYLDDNAKQVWRRLSRELYDTGVLTTIDRDALAAYCQTFSRWTQAEQMIAKTGEVIKGVSGELVRNPYLMVANKALEQMIKLASEFGLTPASRARLKVEKPAQEDDLTAFISRRNEQAANE